MKSLEVVYDKIDHQRVLRVVSHPFKFQPEVIKFRMHEVFCVLTS